MPSLVVIIERSQMITADSWTAVGEPSTYRSRQDPITTIT